MRRAFIVNSVLMLYEQITQYLCQNERLDVFPEKGTMAISPVRQPFTTPLRFPFYPAISNPVAGPIIYGINDKTPPHMTLKLIVAMAALITGLAFADTWKSDPASAKVSFTVKG